jgi:hypothetical protein
MAWMLVLVAVIALAAGAAVHDVLFAQHLANTRTLEQQAMGMAELGLRIGLEQLASGETPLMDTGKLHPDPTRAESLHVILRPGVRRMPDGFSAGRFLTQDYEIQSTGHSARSTRRTLVQGITRLEPLAQGAP